MFLSQFSFSQTYHTLIRPNTTWDVMYYDYNINSTCGYVFGGRYFFNGDSLVNNILYKIVKGHPIIEQNPSPPFCGPFYVDQGITGFAALMREDTITRKVYVFDQTNNADDLLYDFSLNPGDTLQSNYYAGFGLKLVVDSVGTVTLLNGEIRKIFYFVNNSNIQYIEGIGSNSGLYTPLIQGIGFGYEGNCVKENDSIIWQWYNCFTVVGINENLNDFRFNIYPNPSTGNFNIIYLLPYASTGSVSEEGKLEIIDITGKIVYEMRLPQWSTFQQITLPEYISDGLYYCVMTTGDFRWNKKIAVLKE
jgi:hypothetical protein